MLSRIGVLERANAALAAENAGIRSAVEPPPRKRRRYFDETPAGYVLLLALYIAIKVLFVVLSVVSLS